MELIPPGWKSWIGWGIVHCALCKLHLGAGQDSGGKTSRAGPACQPYLVKVISFYQKLET